ncbi:Kelch-like protein 7 [Linum perenne]
MGSVPSPPRPLSSANQTALSSMSSIDHRIYASFCNDTDSNWVECYDPSSNEFTHLGSIPGLGENCVLKDFAMVNLGDSIYVIGGRVVRTERSWNYGGEFDEFVEVEIEVRSVVNCYNVRHDRWIECRPLTQPRYSFACCVCGDKIYVAGGKSSLTDTSGVSLAEVYNSEINTWSSLSDMSVMRYKCVGVTWKGKIYVVGGFASRGNSGKTESFIMERSSAEVYDTKTGRWQVMVGMWQLDVPPNEIVAANEKLFSSGDCLKPWKGHIEAYDGNLNLWNVVDGSHLRTFNAPIQRVYLTMAPIGTHLYFLGGYRTTEECPRMLSRVHIFDTSTTNGQWMSLEPIEEVGRKELCSHCCVVRVSN